MACTEEVLVGCFKYLLERDKVLNLFSPQEKWAMGTTMDCTSTDRENSSKGKAQSNRTSQL